MIDPRDVPPVESDEVLARYVLYRKYIRTDETIRPEAFIPHPYTELSVTRHRDASEQELWDVGRAVAAVQQKNLHGRGDLAAEASFVEGLAIDPDPVLGHNEMPDNPNHANVSGWPRDDRARQRLLAVEIASKAVLVRPPG